jgi:APA family basic amino acid/polyamine antiporter
MDINKNISSSDYLRVLSLKDLVFMGLSLTIGTGIFVLLNNIGQHSKQLTWLSMIIAGILSLLTAFSYGELSGIFKSNTAEYGYIESVAGTKIADISGIILMIADLFVIATVALGLAFYLAKLTHMNDILIAIIVLVVINYINYSGIIISKDISHMALYVKLIALGIIIFLGFIRKPEKVDYFTSEGVSQHQLSIGVIIAIFAYLGFNNMVNLNQESINPGPDIGTAIILTIIIITVLYTLLAFSGLRVLGIDGLSETKIPLATMAEKVMGSYGEYFIIFLAIISIFDTLLVTCVSESRYIHALVENFNKDLGKIDFDEKNKTPYISIILMTIIASLIVIIIKNIEYTAIDGDIIYIFVFVIVNIITIILRYLKPNTDRPFRVPFNIGNFPVPSMLSALIGCYCIYEYINHI